MDFTGRVAIVTGAARGQGRSHAMGLARHGADLVVNDIGSQLPGLKYRLGTLEELSETADQIRAMGRRVVTVPGDMSRSEDVKRLVDAAIQEFGKVDIAVVNHGIFTSIRPTKDMTEEEWDLIMKVNVKGPFLVAKYVLPHMMKRMYGRLIMTSSICGQVAIWGMGNYNASKHAVLGLVRTLAIEYAPYNITVNAVLPTGVDTELLAAEARDAPPDWLEKYIAPINGALSLFPDRSLLKPEDITNGVLWLAAEESRNVTGVALPVDAGFLAK